jgi:UDPglucose 6-dehydrogenase
MPNSLEEKRLKKKRQKIKKPMKIGIIGLGVVGKACKFGFELIGHDVSVHDTALNTKIEDVRDSEIVFICVPTPSTESGSCDISIVEGVVKELSEMGYGGLIAIKSTVEPGTTDLLSIDYNVRVCMVPEFLRERCATTDFTENHDVCIVGTWHEEDFKLIKQAHGELPKQFVRLNPKEAEFVKYFNNTYNATLVTFANSFHDLCEKEGIDYNTVMNAITQRDHVSKKYLQCNANFRGFGGACLPKDTRAMAALEPGTDITFFSDMLKQNNKFKITVLPGMRVEKE